MKSKKKKTALVLGGGGSRGAYEAGVDSYNAACHKAVGR